MTCRAVRENDEMVCWQCHLRWSAGEPTPDDCQENGTDKRQHVSVEQAALKIALRLLSSSETMTDQERQSCLLSVQYVANPNMPIDMKIDKIRETLDLMPSLGIVI